MVDFLPPSSGNKPERFVLIQTDLGYHVFAGWYGGYLGADEWRLSTPIVDVIVETCEEIVLKTKSGSSYVLPKEPGTMYGMTGLMSGVFNSFKEKAARDQMQFDVVEEINFDQTLEKVRAYHEPRDDQ